MLKVSIPTFAFSSVVDGASTFCSVGCDNFVISSVVVGTVLESEGGDA
jgi:hypothetical protein